MCWKFNFNSAGSILALILGMVIFSFEVSAQNTGTVTVNILAFYENRTAIDAFNGALDFFKEETSLGVNIGKVRRIHVEKADEKILVRNLCSDLSNYYKDLKPTEYPDIVLDLTRIQSPTEAVKTISKVMNLPTISGSFGQLGDSKAWRENYLTENLKNYLIQICPPADMTPHVVRSVAARQDMSTAVLLHDEEYEMYHKYKALMQNIRARHLLTRIKRGKAEFRKHIHRLIHVDLTNFFIAARPDEITFALAEASDPTFENGPYFSDEFGWYSLTMEPGYPKCSGCKMNLTLVHLLPVIPNWSEKLSGKFVTKKGLFKEKRLMDLFYFDLTTTAILSVRDMKKNGNWKSPPEWNAANCRENGTPDPNYKLDLYSQFSTESVQKYNLLGEFHLDTNREPGLSYQQFEMEIHRLVFKEKKAEPESNVLIGIWKTGYEDAKLIRGDTEHAQLWKDHIALTVFRVVTVVNPPFVYKIEGCDEASEKYSRCFEGYCIDLLNKLQDTIGFNYTIRSVDKYGMMSDEPPHEWDGMVRELQDRKADIALGALSVMSERENVMDFTVPYYDLVGIAVLMKKPRIVHSLFKFLRVIKNDLWAGIVASFFVTSFFMWVFDRLSPYSYLNNKEKWKHASDDEKRIFTYKECLWFCMTSITPQGGGECPKNLSGRIVAAFWWFFGFMLIALYSATLAAFLTSDRLRPPVETIDDLSKQFRIQYSAMMNSSAWIYLKRMQQIEQRFYQMWKDMSLNESDPDYSKFYVYEYPIRMKFTHIWREIHEMDPPESIQAGVDRILKKDSRYIDAFALIGEATDMRYQALLSCDLHVVGEEVSKKPYSIGVQQNSPLKDLFNDALLNLLNQRYLEVLKEIWWTDNKLRDECPVNEPQYDGINVHNIGGVFIIVAGGVVVAAIIMLVEYWWKRKFPSNDDVSEITVSESDTKELTEALAAVDPGKTDFNTEYSKRTHAAQPLHTKIPVGEGQW